jgi:hypothetical protein
LATLAVADVQNVVSLYPAYYGGMYTLYNGAYAADTSKYFAQIATANAHFFVLAQVTLTA